MSQYGADLSGWVIQNEIGDRVWKLSQIDNEIMIKQH